MAADFDAVVRKRRMVRAFRPQPIDDDVLGRVLDAARRAPTAGNTQGVDLVVLRGDDTARYWDVALPEPRRSRFGHPGLLAAPVLVIPCVTADAYVARYAEDDKARTGLGVSADAWAVPFWWIDAGMATHAVLLAAAAAGLGACFFGLFEREALVVEALGIPPATRPVGVVAVGHPAPDRPGRSVTRPRRSLDDVVHQGGW